MVALELHFLTLKPILGRRWDVLHLEKTFCPTKNFMTENIAWLWLPEHEAEFRRAREILCSNHFVKPFDPALPIKLLTDASRSGLGSCSLMLAQKKYAVIELELCAIWWAAEKCYLHGIHEFKIIKDHRPLFGLFKKPLTSITNGRFQRLGEKLNHYNFDCIWVAGKKHLIADALSCTPLFPADPELDFSLRKELCAAISTNDLIFASLRDSINDDYAALAVQQHDHDLCDL
eukprot:TCALIF_12989-PA protein Name:"Similar to pol Retrovirus-related Pol polyprotein from transposon 17.6 (Drosophila melanogaster)" AED:0.20 eAED:0.20 QI:0/0/0/0.66/1/1/3/0/231